MLSAIERSLRQGSPWLKELNLYIGLLWKMVVTLRVTIQSTRGLHLIPSICTMYSQLFLMALNMSSFKVYIPPDDRYIKVVRLSTKSVLLAMESAITMISRVLINVGNRIMI